MNMNGWKKKPIDRMEMMQILGLIYGQTAAGFGKMGLAMFIRKNGGETVVHKYTFISRALVRSGLLTKKGNQGRGIAYRWNLKEFGPVSIPIANMMIAETEHQIRLDARNKRRRKRDE